MNWLLKLKTENRIKRNSNSLDSESSTQVKRIRPNELHGHAPTVAPTWTRPHCGSNMATPPRWLQHGHAPTVAPTGPRPSQREYGAVRLSPGHAHFLEVETRPVSHLCGLNRPAPCGGNH